MIKEFSRSQRVAREIQKEITIILMHKIKDPRIKIISTISSVEISRDLAYAKVFITFLNNQNEDIINSCIKALKKASGFIRFMLSKTINLRIIPELNFFYDNSLVRGIYISNLVTSIVQHDNKYYVNQDSNKEDQ